MTPMRTEAPPRRSPHRTTLPAGLNPRPRVEPERVSPVRRVIPKPESGRLGSRQVVSVRGRRVGVAHKANRLLRTAGVVVMLLLVGVVGALSLSAVATEQTFQLQQLDATKAQLDNQIETLNRNVEDASSSATLARRAQEMGLEVPVQPGVLSREENGDIVEQRPADPATEPIIDVNGMTGSNAASSARQRATSNPEDTGELDADSLPAVPQGQTAGVAPYAAARN